jgi:transcription elongation factor Elf1
MLKTNVSVVSGRQKSKCGICGRQKVSVVSVEDKNEVWYLRKTKSKCGICGRQKVSVVSEEDKK